MLYWNHYFDFKTEEFKTYNLKLRLKLKLKDERRPGAIRSNFTEVRNLFKIMKIYPEFQAASG